MFYIEVIVKDKEGVYTLKYNDKNKELTAAIMAEILIAFIKQGIAVRGLAMLPASIWVAVAEQMLKAVDRDSVVTPAIAEFFQHLFTWEHILPEQKQQLRVKIAKDPKIQCAMQQPLSFRKEMGVTDIITRLCCIDLLHLPDHCLKR